MDPDQLTSLLAEGGSNRPVRSADCPDESRIAGYVDGGLDAIVRQELERHLADCGHCLAIVGVLSRERYASAAEPVPAEVLAQAGRRLGIADRVFWAGWQNDTAPFYGLADIFVCPSRREPLGNVILEAWQHRLPVLSTRNEGAGALLQDGENGLLAPLSDPAGLAQALSRLLAMSPEALARLAEAGHATLQRDHHESAVLAAYLELWARLGARG